MTPLYRLPAIVRRDLDSRLWLSAETCLAEALRVAQSRIDADPLAFVPVERIAHSTMPKRWQDAVARGEMVRQDLRATSVKARIAPEGLVLSAGIEARVVRRTVEKVCREIDGVVLSGEKAKEEQLVDWRPLKPWTVAVLPEVAGELVDDSSG